LGLFYKVFPNLGLFLNLFPRGVVFYVDAMHGATTTGAFDRDVARGAGVAIPTSASPFADVALEAPTTMAS